LLSKSALEYAVTKDPGSHADVKLLGENINTIKDKISGLLDVNTQISLALNTEKTKYTECRIM
jgi:hypothetical protein